MTKGKDKNQKKLIFRENYVYWPDKCLDGGKATDIGWEFARVALRGEPVHLLDGFLFHDSWLLGEQDGDYLKLFRANKSKAVAKFKFLKIENTKIDRPNKKDLYTFKFYPPSEGLECNITNAVRLARKAREEFHKGNPAAWDLIWQSYEEYPDARSICQALAFALSLPKDYKPYEKCLIGIKKLLVDYREILLNALFKVLCLASEKRQGITKTFGKLAINCWVEEFFDLKQSLLMISQHHFGKPHASTQSIEAFACLLKKYRECIKDVSEIKKEHIVKDEVGIEYELKEAEDAATKYLNQLVHCEAVIDAAEKAIGYYEQEPHLRISANDIYNQRQNTINNFLKRVTDFPDDPDTLYYQFSSYFLNFVEKSNKKQGIEEIFESDKNKDEKWGQFHNILENMEDEEEAKKELRRHFGITVQQLGRQHEGAPIPACVVSSEKDLYRLLKVEEVLETKNPPPARWFREGGPVYSDFKQEKFYRRPEVETIKQQILSNHFFLLEGEAATAKTTIMRTVMYDLYEAGERKIYYFDIARRRNFDEDHLIRSIRSVPGLFIIENVHLELRKVQWIYERFETDPDRRFLLTWRKPDKEFQDPESKLLHGISKLTLGLFEDVEKLIDAYCSDPCTPTVVRQKRQDIVSNCRKDFWLLACALQGCGDSQGQGDPLSWIANKIKTRLVGLETCGDPHADQYPEIIVALSALYKNEVITDQNFLRKLGFSKAALNGLVERGEITWQKDTNDNVFYGLHHSTLADAYWEHGREYVSHRKTRKYEDFIYEYALSETPNSLEAVIKSNNESRRRLLVSLSENGQMLKVIESELSLNTFIDWLLIMNNLKLLDRNYFYSKKLLEIFASKIATTDSVCLIGAFVYLIYDIDHDWGSKLWEVVDHEKLADKFTECNNFWDAGLFIMWMEKADRNNAWEICERLNLKRLSYNMRQAQNFHNICWCIGNILRVNKTKGRELLNILGKEEIASKLIVDKNTIDGNNLACIWAADEETGRDLLGFLE